MSVSELQGVYGLALETSSALGGIALGRGDEVLDARELAGPRRHAVELLPAVEALCKAHNVDPPSVRRVLVSSGPGSFTGLRIGVTVARMIGLTSGASLIAVPTLEVIAQNALEVPAPPDRAVVVLDAKRDRVYTAAFVRRDARYVAVTTPVETDPARFLAGQRAHGGSCAVFGEGVLYHRGVVEASGLEILPEAVYRPRAETVYRLGVGQANTGRTADRRALVPTYVRPPEAEEKWARRQQGQP